MAVTEYGYPVTAGATVNTGGTTNANRALKSPSTIQPGGTGPVYPLLCTAVTGDVLTKISVYTKATSGTGAITIELALYEVSGGVPTTRVTPAYSIVVPDSQLTAIWADTGPISVALTAGKVYTAGFKLNAGRHVYTHSGMTTNNISQNSSTSGLPSSWTETGQSSYVANVLFEVTNATAGNTLAVTEGDDTVLIQQAVTNQLAVTEGADTFLSLQGLTGGTLAVTEGADTFAASSNVGIVIDEAYERSSVNLSLSSVTGTGDSAIVEIYPRSCQFEGIGVRWLEPSARVTGVLGIRPTFRFMNYASGQYHGYPWQTTRRMSYCYPDGNGRPDGNWRYFDTQTLSAGNYIENRANVAFTGNTIFVTRGRQVSVTQVGLWLEGMAASYPTIIGPSPISFSPVNTLGYPAQSYIDDEYSPQTDELGRTVPATPLYSFVINDTSLMPGGPKKLAWINVAIHAGEDLGIWAFMRAIEDLMGSDPNSQEIRMNYKIFVTPALNAPAIVGGGHRGFFASAAGVGSATDANRHFSDASPGFELVTKPRALITTLLAGETPAWMFDYHGYYNVRWGSYIEDGNTLQETFYARLQGNWDSGKGAIVDIGNIPAGSISRYFDTALATPVAMILEYGDAITVPDGDYPIMAKAVWKTLNSMRADGLIPGADTPNSLSVLEGADSILIQGHIPNILAVTEDPDTFLATGNSIHGTLAVTEGPDTFFSIEQGQTVGYLAVTEGADGFYSIQQMPRYKMSASRISIGGF